MKSITAYIRLGNEEHTIIPCLESIKDIFDEILIIHSDINDASLELINTYKNQKLIIQKYPHSVLPPHSTEYETAEYNAERSLASYYNFGLEYIKTELLMKIDADQIYFNDSLRELITKTKLNHKEQYVGCIGHNCIISNNHLYLHKDQPYNGGYDHFIIPTKSAFFTQTKYWEKLSMKYYIDYEKQSDPYWFHLKKGHRRNNRFISGNQYEKTSLSKFNDELIEQYREYVLTLLINNNSKYQYLSI